MGLAETGAAVGDRLSPLVRWLAEPLFTLGDSPVTAAGILKLPWAVLVTEVSEAEHFAVRVRAKAYVLDVRFEKAFETDVHERVLEGFRSAGIAPPARLIRGA